MYFFRNILQNKQQKGKSHFKLICIKKLDIIKKYVIVLTTLS